MGSHKKLISFANNQNKCKYGQQVPVRRHEIWDLRAIWWKGTDTVNQRELFVLNISIVFLPSNFDKEKKCTKSTLNKHYTIHFLLNQKITLI